MTDKDATTPLQNGDMYSTAFQFYSHINATVDPRTGTYGASIELTTGEANLLRGPNLPFRLSYSALSTVNEGFGEGWHLGMTQLDIVTGMLTLSSGDTHKIEGLSPHVPAFFPDRKLDSCSLIATDNNLRTAVVEHVTGVIEHLELKDDRLLCPVRIINPAGDSIQLTWGLVENGFVCLTRVTDDEGQVLLSVRYFGGTAVVLTFHLGHADLTMEFEILGPTLTRVTVPLIAELNTEPVLNEDLAAWMFDYQLENGMRLLREVTFPDGTREDVVYDREALWLPPGAPFRFMPAVAERRRRLVADPATIVQESHYRYDKHGFNNFFGYPIVSNWESRHDQLLHLIGEGDFLYGGIEEQRDGANTLCTISREYDQFHLILNEVTTRGTVVQEVRTEYGAVPNTPFPGQPKNFQLPHRVTTTRYDTVDPGVRQVTYVESDYNELGNVERRYDSATDTTEVSDYYPPEGETDDDGVELCPPDPIGLVRRLKSRRTEPGAKGGPIRSTHYRYRAVPVRETGRPWLRDRQYYVQASAETTRTLEDGEERDLVQSEQFFVEDQGDQHGSLLRETRRQDDLTEIRQYTYETDRAGGTVTTTTAHTTHDEIVTTYSETLHLLSGLVKATEDAHGNRTTYTYDAMGRRTSEVLAPDIPEYRVETRWNYQLSMAARWVERIGITGLPHRVWMDEQGRVIRRQEPLPDRTLVTVHEMTYDGFGQLIREVHSDQLHDDLDVHVETLYQYDDWGQRSYESAADGSATVSKTDLVPGLTSGETLTRTVQWQIYGADEKTGWRSAYTDAAGRQVLAEAGTWSPAGEPIVESATRWDYDGLGRCVTMTESFELSDDKMPSGKRPLERVTQQTWDDYDRLATSTLPDNSVVMRRYAPGQEDELLASIAVRPFDASIDIPLGTRDWDGLGRSTSERAGSLTFGHVYEPGQLSAARKIMPDGSTIDMSYDLRLREVLLAARLTSGDTGTNTGISDTTYDKQVGLPTHIDTPEGDMGIALDYLGRMTAQTIRLTGDIERNYEANVSLGGLTLDKIGADGVHQTYEYDEIGRLSAVKDQDVTIELTYDPLSRLESRTSVSRLGRIEITQRFAYDAHGRINTVTLQHEGEGAAPLWRQIRLAWRPDDKLVGRSWYAENEVLLRAETMDYDDRGRLIEHVIEAAEPDDHPRDEMNAPYVRQRFTHDSIDNLLTVETTRLDGQVNTTLYGYDTEDVDRLVSVSNSLPTYPGYGTPLALQYDRNGNLIDDGQGRTLVWDGAGRLLQVVLADGRRVEYTHGPSSRVSRVTIDGEPSFRYHEDGALSFEAGSESRRFIRAAGSVVAETRIVGAIRDVLLLGTDPQGSVVTESVALFTSNGEA